MNELSAVIQWYFIVDVAFSVENKLFLCVYLTFNCLTIESKHFKKGWHNQKQWDSGEQQSKQTKSQPPSSNRSWHYHHNIFMSLHLVGFEWQMGSNKKKSSGVCVELQIEFVSNSLLECFKTKWKSKQTNKQRKIPLL